MRLGCRLADRLTGRTDGFAPEARLILLASGSEVHIALAAQASLAEEGGRLDVKARALAWGRSWGCLMRP